MSTHVFRDSNVVFIILIQQCRSALNRLHCLACSLTCTGDKLSHLTIVHPEVWEHLTAAFPAMRRYFALFNGIKHRMMQNRRAHNFSINKFRFIYNARGRDKLRTFRPSVLKISQTTCAFVVFKYSHAIERVEKWPVRDERSCLSM